MDFTSYEDITIFDILYPTFKINNPIRLIELFGGIGSQAMALRDIGANFEHYKLAEWEINAIMSYKAIHMPNDCTDYSKDISKEKLAKILYQYGLSIDGKNPLSLEQITRHKGGEHWQRSVYNAIKSTNNLCSITNFHGQDLCIIEVDKYTYIMTYSFPCQDLSVAGKMKGMSKGSGTRSGLLWEVERLLNETVNLPQVLLMENVPEVIGAKNIKDFHMWQDFLESKGYTNYVQTLNAKDYGVAQNRERCFMVSLLGKYNYKFSQPIPLTKTMADYLEDEVDEKYYINSEKAQILIKQLMDSGQIKNGVNCADGTINEPKVKDISNCIMAKDYGISTQKSSGGGSNQVLELGYIEKGTGQHQSNTIYSSNGISPCINAVNYKEPLKVVID